MELPESRDEVRLLPVATLSLWTGCLLIGILGFWMAYPKPIEPAKEMPPVTAQRINVDISSREEQAAGSGQAADAGPPPMPGAVVAPNAPQMSEVVAASAAIAFAKPVAGPPHPATVTTAPSAVRHITYGQGEGRQPAPEYPREAAIAHQEGVVVVRFTVDAQGTVKSAEAIKPSPWPLLNQAAVRAVSEDWRFSAGTRRTYEVSIQFELRQRSQ